MTLNKLTYLIGAPDGSDLGPFSFEQIKKKIEGGEVLPETFIKRSDGDSWSTASEFSEFKLRHVAVETHGEKSAMLQASEEMGNMMYGRIIRKASIVFFWIGAYSILNATLAYFGGGKGYALGLQLAFLLGDAGRAFESTGSMVVYGVNLVLSFLFLGFGVASWHNRLGPFLVGCGLYLGDLFLSVYLVNWPGILVHFIALLFLYEGIETFLEWKERSLTAFLPTILPAAGVMGGLGIGLSLLFPSSDSAPKTGWMAGAMEIEEKAEWMKDDPKEWPQILLTHEADFSEYGNLEGASAFLMEMRDGEIIGVTARHLIGFAGGLPGLKLRDVKDALVTWNLSARGVPEPKVGVSGLLGNLSGYEVFYKDVIALELESYPEVLPFTPLQFRSTVVKPGERVFVIGVPYGDEVPQRVYPGRITIVSDHILDGHVEEQVDMMGFSGAPIIDDKGLVVAVLTGPGGLGNREKERGFSSHSILELGTVLPVPGE